MTWTGTASDGSPADALRGVRVVSPAPRNVWEQLLQEDPGALPTQTPRWIDWLCTRGYVDASRLYEFRDGRQLVLPLVARKLSGVSTTEESMPSGFGYGGPLVPGGRPSADEVRAVLADLSRRPVLRASLMPDPATAPVWRGAAPPGAVEVPYLAHVLDLEGGYDAVLSERFRSRVRRDVRRAANQGLEIRTTVDSDAVAVFAELNRRSVERWAHQRGQPLWMAALVERQRDRAGQLASALPALGSMVGIWTAHLAGEPVAVCVTLRFREQAYLWMTAMDKSLARRTLAGTLLHALAIEDACRGGARRFLLGESDPGSGVAMFKEGFGAVPVPFSALRFERLPVTAADDRLRSTMARLGVRSRWRSRTGER